MNSVASVTYLSYSISICEATLSTTSCKGVFPVRSLLTAGSGRSAAKLGEIVVVVRARRGAILLECLYLLMV